MLDFVMSYILLRKYDEIQPKQIFTKKLIEGFSYVYAQ